MNALAAALLAAGELICEFPGQYQRDLLADLAREPQRRGQMLFYEALAPDSAGVLSSNNSGRNAVRVIATRQAVHLVEPVAGSVRVTTLTRCERWKTQKGADICTRFTAHHAWHFDPLVFSDPDAAFAKLASGVCPGACEPWSVD